MASMRRVQCSLERWLALLAILVASLMSEALCTGQPGSPSAQQIPFQLASGSALGLDASKSSQYRNVIDELNASKEHLIFTRLLQRSRLVPIINRIQEFDDDGVGLTVLAPRDSAWPVEIRTAYDHSQAQQTLLKSEAGDLMEKEVAKWLGVDLVDNVNEALQDLMLYHFVDRSILTELDDLAGTNSTMSKLLSTLQKSHAHMGRERPRPLLDEGQKIWMWYNGSDTSFGWAYGKGAVSQVASLKSVHNCTRGLVVSLDKVLRAPPTFESVLQTHPDLSYLRDIMSKEELIKIGQTPSLTSFLPASSAFKVLSDLERRYLEGPWAIAHRDDFRVLAWHLAAAPEVLYSDRLNDSLEVRTALGGTHHIEREADKISIDRANIMESDILTASGSIHIIDTLLTPYKASNLALSMEKVMLASNASHFVELIHRAGLKSYIDRSPEPDDDDNEDAPSRQPLTFLAPRDRAIIRKNRTGGGQIHLQEVVEFHFLARNYSLDQFKNGMLVPTKLRPPELGGHSQRIKVHAGKNVERTSPEISFGEADVVADPIRVGDDQLYLISELLETPSDPLQVAVSTLTLSTFVAWIYSAELENVVRHHPGVTGFFPHNDAFNALGMLANHLLHPNNRDTLQSVIKYHLVDEVLYSHKIKGREQLHSTLQGSSLSIERGKARNVSATSRGFTANMTRNRDLLCSNGVLHEMTRVMMPPDLEVSIGDLLHSSKLDTMVELIKVSNYSWLLDDGGPYVVLAPTSDGFGGTNLTRLRSDTQALDRFIGLHVIAIPPRPVALEQYSPLALQDGLTLESMSGGQFSSLALRRLSSREREGAKDTLGFQIGILGARGTSGQGHAAKLLSHGVQFRNVNDTRPVGGVIVIESALEPYEPDWFYRWGWIVGLAILGLIVSAALLLTLLRFWLARRKAAATQPLEGEEE